MVWSDSVRGCDASGKRVGARDDRGAHTGKRRTGAGGSVAARTRWQAGRGRLRRSGAEARREERRATRRCDHRAGGDRPAACRARDRAEVAAARRRRRANRRACPRRRASPGASRCGSAPRVRRNRRSVPAGGRPSRPRRQRCRHNRLASASAWPCNTNPPPRSPPRPDAGAPRARPARPRGPSPMPAARPACDNSSWRSTARPSRSRRACPCRGTAANGPSPPVGSWRCRRGEVRRVPPAMADRRPTGRIPPPRTRSDRVATMPASS